MTTPVNLNKVRKAQARAEKRARADQNAIRFGQTKAEKQAVKRAQEKAKSHLDRHKRDP